MKKRILRKFADSGRRFNLNNGLFGAEQVQYVVCTAIHNIDGRQTLILYVYAKEAVLAGDFTPRWTVFQTRNDYITLYRDEESARWQTSMFNHLGKSYNFSGKCAFYSLTDEQRVTRFCKMPAKEGFLSLSALQGELLDQKWKKRKMQREKRFRAECKRSAHFHGI